MTRVVTFYSYKGGVGRTMALVNTAYVLARSGFRVLMVDFDLEAPGMTHFFVDQIRLQQFEGRRDAVDLLLAARDGLANEPDLGRVTFESLDEYVINLTLP